MTDLIVLGGGAAGMMCAATAGGNGARVLLLEHNAVPGKKIRISGGGRCNFTNRIVQSNNFICSNPDFTRSALARYTPNDFIALLERYNIRWHEKTLGQLFCDSSAQQVIDMMVTECLNANVTISCGVMVTGVTQQGTGFVVHTSQGDLATRNVVVATGGLSIPTLGATDLGYRIAKHFDIAVVPTAAALVPLLTNTSFRKTYGQLTGVSAPCIITAHGIAFTEAFLITHRGLSGPAVLQLSSYLSNNDELSINLFPSGVPAEILTVAQSDKRLVRTIASLALPARLLAAWPDERISQPRNSMSANSYADVLAAMQEWKVSIVGNEGYAKAEVTRGGVSTHALSSKTMESATVPGLYFIGECVDVTGWLGGYNFQWAWSSGYAAGIAIRERIRAST